MNKNKKAWGGRFSKPTNTEVERFTESVSFDWRLYREDIAGSIAHATMLAKCKLIKAGERDRIIRGLRQIEKEIAEGTFQLRSDREDIHMNIEAALTERIGEAGKRLHTARSRNDQVATDLRLWVRNDIDRLLTEIEDLQSAFVLLADGNRDLVLPGFTHLQHAQPVMAAHYLLAYVEMLERDRQRLVDCRKRANISSLGSCALAGSTLPTDPKHTAKLLEFDGVARNSLDSVSDRDFCAEFVFCLSLIGVHLSRLAEEWIIWCSEGYGFIDIDDAFCTGSSHMPQKKNPDILELIRGRTGRPCGALAALLTILKGLPLTYNRDLQEDKLHVFTASDSVHECVVILAALLRNVRFRRERIGDSLKEGFLDATGLSEYLVSKGVPLRSAHEVVGLLVQDCVSRGKRLSDLSLDELRRFSKEFTADVKAIIGAQNAVKAFKSYGSTAPARVKTELGRWLRRFKIKNVQ